MSIGTNIKKIRESKGLEIDFVVKQLNIFKAVYLNIEKNIIKPNASLILKIANVLGVSEKDIRNYNSESALEDSIRKQQIDLLNLNISSKELDINLSKKSNIFSRRPILVTNNELDNISSQVGENLNYVEEEVDPLNGLIVDEAKSFSPQLLNWVEPYLISGVRKTLFYTEVNSGLKVGDRVFIINGNYDSDLLIKANKYKSKRDGYKVLMIDNCKIVLDIDYTGYLPFNSEDIDNFINIYYIDNLYDFINVNRQITTRGDNVDYKFNQYQNNIIYTNNDFPNPILGWGENLGLTGSPGFFVKNGTSSWINITNDIISGSFSMSLSPTYSNNNRIKINNGHFSHYITNNIVEFKENYVYKWDIAPEPDSIPGTYSTWMVDVIYNKPILSKGNFRDGSFKGIWNGGVFGRTDKKIIWKGNSSKWYGGTLLRAKWENGTFDNIYTLANSYLAELDSNGIPFQKVNEPNNNGWSFNYAIDSEFEESIINNGNILNSKVGLSNPTFSTVETHILNIQNVYKNKVNKALFSDCSFIGGIFANSDIKKSRLLNSKLDNSKSINSSYKSSVIKDSTYLSDETIKILRYEELNMSQLVGINGTSHKVYKFYINREDFNLLKSKERFYIKGLKFNNNSNYPINFFDKKFRISSWTEYEDHYWTGAPLSGVIDNSFYKRGYEISVSLSTPGDNKWKYNTFFDGISLYYTDVTTQNTNSEFSIDISISISDKNSQVIDNLDFNTDRFIFGTTSNYISNMIDISDAYIVNSDFESGLFENSDWNNGYNINFNNDVNITDYTISGGYYNLSISTASSEVIANTLFDNSTTLPEIGADCLELGDIVFLNSVFYDTLGRVDSILLTNQGSSYSSMVGVTTSGGSGNGLLVNIISTTGSITSVSINTPGIGYTTGDVLTINSGNYDADIEIISVTGSLVELPDTYKISGRDSITGITTLMDINGSASIIQSLLPGGIFYTPDSRNRWGYIHKSKISKSKIKSGIFRRSYIKDSIIENIDFNSNDKDLLNLKNIKSLVMSDILFTNNSNTLSKALYLNSNIVNGSDKFINGIIYNSLWNGATFSNGVFRNSTWLSGTFENGIFYNNKSFNAYPSQDYQFYDNDRIKTYNISGVTSPTISNDRYSWQNGLFNGGLFYKSDWEAGDFNNGSLYYSKFYSGNINGGVIGDNSVPVSSTHIYNANINYTTVRNATLFSYDTSWDGLSSSNINWLDGIFETGVFGSDITQITASNTAVWNGGLFNGGEFISNATWKDGTFNGGKFISGFGWTMSGSTTQSDYTWESGIFNGGEFGNANLGTNSTWYTGEFNGGEFKGRVWNDGLFTSGEFIGSSTWSAVGGYNVNSMSQSNAYNFSESYTQSYYGLWRSGYFTNIKDKFIKDKKLFTSIIRSKSKERTIRAKFKNALWQSGTFSHENGEFNNSLWLDGQFEAGTFKKSSLNPWVIREGDTQPSFNLNDDLVAGSGSCIWNGGRFEDSDFYISQWIRGRFISGTAFGMVWKNGVTNYMNAYNVFWEDGLWRNGNWQGSYFDFNGDINNPFDKQIIFRGMSWSGTASCHVWNVFKSESPVDVVVSDFLAGTPSAATMRMI
jgi:transcriptional regulator with XRE-family HTH domain